MMCAFSFKNFEVSWYIINILNFSDIWFKQFKKKLGTVYEDQTAKTWKYKNRSYPAPYNAAIRFLNKHSMTGQSRFECYNGWS